MGIQDKNRKENRKEKPDIALINNEEYIIHHIGLRLPGPN